MYKKLLGTVVVALSLAFSTAGFAASCGEGMRHMLESMKLDDSQKQKIKPIMETLKSSMQQNGEQMRDLSKQINEQVISPNMDQTVVNDLIDKKSKLLGDMMKANVTAKNQIYAILNSEQKTDLQNKMKKVEEEMADRFKKCHDED